MSQLSAGGSHLVQVGLNPRGTKLTRDEQAALWRRTERAAPLPGVAAASRAASVALLMTWSPPLHVPGIDSVSKLGEFDLQAGSPDYFATAGTRILRGRGFSRGDGTDAPKVVVVSESMARALWPHQDAIGRCIRVGADTSPCRTVVGIAEDVKAHALKCDPGLMYYLPIDQFAPAAEGMFVRTRGDARTASEGVRRALQRLMPGAAYVTVLPMPDVIDDLTRSWRLGATMFTIFGLLALTLASVGTTVGAAIALGASRFIAPLLYDVSPRDPVVYVGVMLLLLAVAATASMLPAWRAARVDPSVTFRTE